MPVPDFSDERPPYLQIAADLNDAIGRDYKPGDKLPAQRSLASTYGVSPQTIKNALRVLAEAKVVAAKGTIGVFVLRVPGGPLVAAQPVGEQIGLIQEELRALQGRVDSDIAVALGRIEANLMDLYAKLAFDYTHEAPPETPADSGKAATS